MNAASLVSKHSAADCKHSVNDFNTYFSSNFQQTDFFSTVIPVPKCDHPKTVSDFRPILLLPCVVKLFEKMFVTEFVLPVIRTKVRDSQFAYVSRAGAGAMTAAVLAYHKVLEFLDSSRLVRMLSVDFSKAEKLPHSCILSACSKFD